MNTSLYTTKKVTHIRINDNLLDFLSKTQNLYILDEVFGPSFKLVYEEDENNFLQKSIARKMGIPIVSLAKHVPADYNFDLSRLYDMQGNFRGFTSTTKGSFDEQVDSVNETEDIFLFDEDIGSGYLIELLIKRFQIKKGIRAIPLTYLKFDPKTEEVIDLKDFIYKYSDTAGLVVSEAPEGLEELDVHRVPYMINKEILIKFASIKPVFAQEIQKVFWRLSLQYHQTMTFNKTYIADCELQLKKLGEIL